MANIDATQCQPYSTKNQMAPSRDEGPKAIPLQMDFNLAASYDVDLSNLSDSNRFTILQGVYVDNSLNASAVSITVNDQIRQTLTFPSASQGYLPILCTMPIKLNFSSAGNVVVKVDLLNFPVAACVWKV